MELKRFYKSRVNIDIYRCNIDIWIYSNNLIDKVYNKASKLYKKTRFSPQDFHTCYATYQGRTIMLFLNLDQLDFGMLVHEITHVTNFVMGKMINQDSLSLSHDEPYCYLIEKISDNIWRKIKKYKLEL